MEKVKNGKKILIVLGIIILIIAIYFICFYRGTGEDDKKSLTMAEEITLNDNEKELLSELINVNDKLLNPTPTENTEETDYTEIAKPTEPISLKEFCLKLYEARKTTNENGDIIYLFDMDTKGKNGNTVRRKIVTSNGVLTGCTFVESDYESMVQTETSYENGTINLGSEFVKIIFDGLTDIVNEMWGNATIYDNVNYDNIFKKI